MMVHHSRNLERQEDESLIVMRNRRKMYRLRVTLRISCWWAAHKEPVKILSENINILGLKFNSKISMPVGDVITMKILLHSPFPNITLEGRCVWCRKLTLYGETPIDAGFEGGIEFLARESRALNYLGKFIDKYWMYEFDPLYFGSHGLSREDTDR